MMKNQNGGQTDESKNNPLFNNGREAATIVENLEELYSTVKTVISKPEEKAKKENK